MRDNVIRFLENTLTHVTIARGEVYTLAHENEASLPITNVTLSSSQPEDVRVLSGLRVEGVKAGTATVTVRYTVRNSSGQSATYQAKVNVSVVEPRCAFSALAAALLPICIDDTAKTALREQLDVVSCRDLLDKAAELGVERLAQAMQTSAFTVRLWLRQAALFEVEGMEQDFALAAALAGLRNACDLAHANAAALNTALRVAAPGAAAVKPSFRLPGSDVTARMIAQAGLIIPAANPRFSLVLEGEPAPDYLLDDTGADVDDMKQLRQGLQFLKTITVALPLPRVINGQVLLNGRKRDDDPEPLAGCVVSLSGITNPAQDRSENDRDLFASTDEDGWFHIVMPEKYNLHECVTFTVTYQDASALAMTLVQGSQRLHTMTFVKRASELMDAEFVTLYHTDGTTTTRSARQILADLDRMSLLDERRQRLEAQLREKALQHEALLLQRNEVEQARHDYMELVDALRGELVFHCGELETQLARVKQALYETVVKLAAELRFHLAEQHHLTQGSDFAHEVLTQLPPGSITGDRGQLYRELAGLLEQAMRATGAELVEVLQYHLFRQTAQEEWRTLELSEACTALFELVIAKHFPGELWQCDAYLRLKQQAEELDEERLSLEFELSQLDPELQVAEQTYQRIYDEHYGHCAACTDPEEDEALRLGRDSQFYHMIEELSRNAMESCELFLDKAERYRTAWARLTQLEAQLAHQEQVQLAMEQQNLVEAYCAQFLVLDEKGVPETIQEQDWTVQRYSDETVQTYFSVRAELAWLTEILYSMDVTTNDIAQTIRNFLSGGLYALLAPFRIARSRLLIEDPHPRALPSVRLMGEGNDAVFLPTDTAPSRVFRYSMLQRLVEPDIGVRSQSMERQPLRRAIDVMDFKQSLYQAQEDVPTATSLGIGYVLNMVQAWVPDGFALGSLLYSLVLAPGEEQRLIVQEHQERYQVSDEASARDTIDDTYHNTQNDSESAAFQQAANRFSGAHSDYTYSSTARSSGSSHVGLFFGLGASSKASSTNSGSGSSNASQTDSYDEVSSAAQAFQSEIKTASARLASAKRASIRVASSSESESVSSKLIANHNHSHVMTVQYWEVTRHYRMETAIDSIDLVLFVPLKLVQFLPTGVPRTLTEAQRRKYQAYQFPVTDYKDFTKAVFAYRYENLLRYSDVLLDSVPAQFRGGITLVRQFSAYPQWTITPYQSGGSELRVKLTGCFIEADQLNAVLCFRNGEQIEGDLEDYDFLVLHPSLNTRQDVLYGLKKLRAGKQVRRKQHKIAYEARIDRFEETAVGPATAVFCFHLSPTVSRHDISHITLENRLDGWEYRLSQETAYMEDAERVAVKNYEHWKYNFSHDNQNNAKDQRKIEHYREGLPECYVEPLVHLSRAELLGVGQLRFKAYLEDTDSNARDVFSASPFASGHLAGNQVRLSMADLVPTLGYDELMEIEAALQHVAANTLHYSQQVWASLTDNERILMLEPYTIDINLADFSAQDTTTQTRAFLPDAQQNGTPQQSWTPPQNRPAQSRVAQTEPLLNCVNAKKLIGFYGNCMLLPFTYPQSLAQKLGKTAGEVQDELYRYHTTNFRVPSTVISVPTDGMVGEAVLGATNVSEKIDITRFWNWKDSEIDHLNIDQNALSRHSLLDRADTKSVDAPTVGVTPTAHIDGSNPLAALLARQQPTFADALGNTDIRQLLAGADSNASAGREAVVAANTDMVKSTIAAATEVAKAAATGGLSSLGGALGDTDNIKSALGALGMSDSDIGSVVKKLESGKLNTSDLLQNVVNTVKKQPGGRGGGGDGGGDGDGGGGDGGEEPSGPKPEPVPDDPTPDPDSHDPVEPDNPVPDPENGKPGGADDPAQTGTAPEPLSGADAELVERMVQALRGGENALDFFQREYGEAVTLDGLNELADQVCASYGTTTQELLCAAEQA